MVLHVFNPCTRETHAVSKNETNLFVRKEEKSKRKQTRQMDNSVQTNINLSKWSNSSEAKGS